MKKESKQLMDKSINSLILSIEHFNRPSDIGRVESTLIFIDHAFEGDVYFPEFNPQEWREIKKEHR